MKPSTLALIVVAVIVVLGGFMYIVSAEKNEEQTDKTQTVNKSPTTTQIDTAKPQPTTEETFTVEEVGSHSTETDCWTIIDGAVYDITSYVPRHPGGDEIIRACGADGTSLFNSRATDGGQLIGSGTPHSTNASNQLRQLKIGTLLN